MKLATFVAAAVLALATPSFANDFETTADGSFFEGEVRFTGEFHTVYTFRWYPMDVNGRFAICGIGFFRDAGFRSTVRDMARDAEFFVNEQGYPVDMSHFTRVTNRNHLVGGTASCRQTNVPVAGAQTVGIQFGRGTYRN